MDHKKKTTGKTETAGKNAKKITLIDDGKDKATLEVTEEEKIKKVFSKKEVNKKAREIKNKDRVVLALSTEQANKLKDFLFNQNLGKAEEPIRDLMLRIANRIEKTLNNQEAKELGYPRGTKQIKEEGAI